MFSIVSAVYNVARYLPDFIASIEAQTFSLEEVEVIMVDDGSTDESAKIIRDWQTRNPGLVSLVQRENGGQSAARNDGLERARGAWVTFTDPDDRVNPEYLHEVAASLERWPSTEMVATRRIILRESSGELVDEHPLWRMFESGNQLRDLDRFPNFFHGSAPAAFFRRSSLEDDRLRFDARIRPNFEDGNFCQQYLLRREHRHVAFLRTAEYHYRKRADNSSTLSVSSYDPRRFIDVPRYGYLELLQEAADFCGGRAPAWLQSMIIYELSLYISPQDKIAGAETACHGAVADQFVELLKQIRFLLDDSVIDAFRARRLRTEWYQVLRHGLVDLPWHSELVLHSYDAATKQVLFSYRWTGPEPQLEVLLKGKVASPVTSKIRSWEYFDHALMRERMVWAPANGSFSVRLNGRTVSLSTEWAKPPTISMRPTTLRRALGHEPSRPSPVDPRRSKLNRFVTLRAAQLRIVSKYFRNAWVLLDRVDEADDSAEILFSHLRAHHPEVNAWFVIDRRTAEGRRVRKKYGRRVVAYRSFRWLMLMLNAQHVVSSQVGGPITDPPEITELGVDRSWKVTFLQHGVIKSDLASWLNPKNIDLFVTSTPAEHESIVGDGTRYKFTDKEVQLLGLPRFDDLLHRDAAHGDSPRDLVLIAPTWRDWLNKPLEPGRVSREVVDNLADTEWVKNWIALLGSVELAKACQERGLEIGFLPHPNMQPALAKLDVPSHVRALRYDDVRALFPRTAVLVTDYSSIVFNTGLLDRPAVYFQFDEERVEQGGHIGRAGYYDYRRDGYGPVTTNLEDAIRETIASLEAGGHLQQPYRDRASIDFAHVRDAGSCERVVQAIKAMQLGVAHDR